MRTRWNHLRPLLLLTLLVPAVLATTGAPASAIRARAGCEGAVVHTVDASRPGPLPKPCIAVGGVLRIANLGPGSVRARPAGHVDCFYAGGVTQCRLLRTGSVRFTLGAADRVLAVRVWRGKAGSPAPACAPAGTAVSLSTLDELPWWSPCLRVGATLRITDLGPGLLKVHPRSALSCHYEAGVHACKVRKPATIDLTAVLDTGARSVTVVAVR